MNNVAARPSDFGRGRPLASLALAVGLLGLHHAWAMSQGTIYPWLLLFLSFFAGLAIAGCVHPPVFFALTKYGQHLPVRYKVIGAVCAAAGAGGGLYLLIGFY